MKRLIYLDFLRVFAVFCVVILHVSAGNWAYVPVNSQTWEVFNIFNSSVRFAVPIFVMISGALLLDTEYNFNFKTFFKKNIMRIITAYIFWSGIYTLVNFLDNGGTFSDNFKFFLSGYSHLWYLYMILGMYIILPFLREIAKNEKLSIYFVVLAFVFTYFAKLLSAVPELGVLNEIFELITSKMSLNFVLGYTGYFFLGHILKNREFKNTTKYIFFGLGALSLITTVLLTRYYSVLSGVATDIFYSYFMPNVFFVALAVFLLFKDLKIPEKHEKNIILLSNLTFGVYLFHPLANRYIYGFITTTSINPLISVPLISILSFIISACVSYSISKIKILNKYII